MTDSPSLLRIIQEVQPDEIYNLAAQSHVGVSFEEPEYTANSDALGTLRILEAMRTLDLQEKTRFYQASTSELYGKVADSPQTEQTPFYPRSPYGVAKLYAYGLRQLSEAYGFFNATASFNHESPVRVKLSSLVKSLVPCKDGRTTKHWIGNLMPLEIGDTQRIMLRQCG